MSAEGQLLITSLPEIVLLKIENFLTPEESQSLGLVCKRLYTLLPRYLVIKGMDFEMIMTRPLHRPGPGQPSPFPPGLVPDDPWYVHPDEPAHYFDGPPLSGPVKKLSISLTWRDQGWGGTKGDVFFGLIRGEKLVAKKYDALGRAPHKEEHAHTDIIDDPVVTEARKGDYYMFMKNAGGGGGHALYVKNYKVVVHYY